MLRSRRLALGLILTVAAYSVVGTLVPQNPTGAAASQWANAHPGFVPIVNALGLLNAFSAPIFLVLIGLLAISTAACTWERARAAARVWMRHGSATEAELRAVRDAPSIVVEATGDDPLAEAGARLERLRLRVRRGPKLLEATSARAGALTSPLFHLLLTLLFLTVAVGRLTRAEGAIGVTIGRPVIDERASYLSYSAGPFFMGHSGLVVTASDLILDYHDADGVARGPSPLVTLFRDGRQVARRRVYPNSPLRYGRLLMHMAGYGLSAHLTIETTGTAISNVSLIDFVSSPTGTTRNVVTVQRADRSIISTFTVTIPADMNGNTILEVLPADPSIIVGIDGRDAGTLKVGKRLTLPDGTKVRLDSVGYYARLSVADDWSIYPIYILFVLAGVAMSAAMLLRYRRVLVLLVDEDGGSRLQAILRPSGQDPLFAQRVECALRGVAAEDEASKEEIE
jgi:hypothetical protein